MSIDRSQYMCSEDQVFLPFGHDYLLPQAGRALLYLIGMLWTFMGIAIFADIFMQAIFNITSSVKVVKVPDPNNEGDFLDIEVKRWNGTVANLTLMALGSSAPEILLSVIEILSNKFISGSLGPSTIIGSAAFNLFFITALCMISIPTDEVRRIKHIKVFIVTTVFSIVAYIWLVLILIVISPDFVDLWEAFITLLLFPILVLIAYMADKDYCMRRTVEDVSLLSLDPDDDNVLHKPKADAQVVSELMKRLRQEKDVSEQDLAILSAHLMEKNQSHEPSWYRINAIRGLTGSSKLTIPMNKKTEELMEELYIQQVVGSAESVQDDIEKKKESRLSIIEFEASSTAIMECEKKVLVNIKRYGNKTQRVIFRAETIDGTAEAVSDYIPFKETLIFEPNETNKQIEIKIIDDNVWEPDEIFFIRLLMDPDQKAKAKLGTKCVTQVVILNDDEPGTLSLKTASHLFKESVGIAEIPVERTNGADGKVSVKWTTKDITATAGFDYINTSGELLFDHGETLKMIEILIVDDKEYEKDENFEVMLTETTGGAHIGSMKRTVVTIVNDDDFSGFVSRVTELTNANLDGLRLHRQTWGQQFKAALNVNSGDLDNATTLSYVMHVFTFFWKLLAAFIPPPTMLGGWLCFIFSLIFIGFLTTIVLDLATVFGCLVGLKPEVTAVTFVALGTSLPDLFASRQAAIHEKHADFAIGNITGSNSVNVFLGLGLPWVIAAIYWSSKDATFQVKAGTLGYSVVVFTVCAVAAIIILLVKRNVEKLGKAELGGPVLSRYIIALSFLALWFLYVLLVSLQAYGHIGGF